MRYEWLGERCAEVTTGDVRAESGCDCDGEAGTDGMRSDEEGRLGEDCTLDQYGLKGKERKNERFAADMTADGVGSDHYSDHVVATMHALFERRTCAAAYTPRPRASIARIIDPEKSFAFLPPSLISSRRHLRDKLCAHLQFRSDEVDDSHMRALLPNKPRRQRWVVVRTTTRGWCTRFDIVCDSLIAKTSDKGEQNAK